MTVSERPEKEGRCVPCQALPHAGPGGTLIVAHTGTLPGAAAQPTLTRAGSSWPA